MNSDEIRKRFLDFFKKRGHKIVPSSSLIPDDPSVLLTTAGMQQFKKYYTGEADPIKDFGSKNTASIQKSFRTSDIDCVGDESHLTFFEMLGNFSFGGYFKKEAIEFAFDFIKKEMGLPISYITIFNGSEAVPKDKESKQIWEKLGIKDIREQGMDDVFWGPTGFSGPCGPTTEIYCRNAAGQDIEIWNIVFNEFFCTGSREDLIAGKAELKPLPFKGIDTGMGLERLAMISQGTKTIFETDLFQEPFNYIWRGSVDIKRNRIISDHIRGVFFLLADGVRPSNKNAGYILRRLIRRALFCLKKLELDWRILLEDSFEKLSSSYKNYPELQENRKIILDEFTNEAEKFYKTLDAGIIELRRRFSTPEARISKTPPITFVGQRVSGKEAFAFYQTYGLSLEIVKDYARENFYIFNEESENEFNEEFKKHQQISRAGKDKKFGGHGLILDTGELKAETREEQEKTIRLHTATHLLLQALRDILGKEVEQKGSDINSKRARFDFAFSRKLTKDELSRVENIVNQKIKEDLPVFYKEMSKDEAEKTDALHFFNKKYPDVVKVYYIGKTIDSAYSKEFCNGPHAKKTGEIGKFKIVKEETVASGIRRIRGLVE